MMVLIYFTDYTSWRKYLTHSIIFCWNDKHLQGANVMKFRFKVYTCVVQPYFNSEDEVATDFCYDMFLTDMLTFLIIVWFFGASDRKMYYQSIEMKGNE